MRRSPVTPADPGFRGDGRLLVLCALCAAFVLRQFYGMILAAVAPDISHELVLPPDALGTLAGLHLAVFAAMQLPVGLLLDRYGSRAVMPTLLVAVALGSVVFGRAGSIEGLIVGYTLIGLGLSGMLMGSLLVLSQRFPLERLASYSSILLAAGGAGTLISSAPFAYAAQWFGWRSVFLAMGLATLAAAAFLLATIDRRSAPSRGELRPRTLGETARGFRDVWRNRNLPPILGLSLFSFSTLSIMRGVWAGPYLHDVFAVGGTALGNVLLIMSVGIIIGTLGYGPLDRVFKSRKKVVMAGALSSAATLTALAVLPHPGLPVATLLLGILGTVGPYDVVLLTHARMIFPAELAGRGLTTVNIVAFIGAAVMQAVTGLAIDILPGWVGGNAAAPYRIVFGLMAVGILCGLCAYTRAQDIAPVARPAIRPGDKPNLRTP